LESGWLKSFRIFFGANGYSLYCTFQIETIYNEKSASLFSFDVFIQYLFLLGFLWPSENKLLRCFFIAARNDGSV
jgi:hypothetical protein